MTNGISNLGRDEITIISDALKRLADNSDETNKRLNQQGNDVVALQSTIKMMAQEMHKSTENTNRVIQDLASKIEHQGEMTSALTLELKEVVMTVKHAENKALSEIDNVKETVDNNEIRFHQDIKTLEERLDRHAETCDAELAQVKARVEILEKSDVYEQGVKSQKEKQKKFWENNWFKIIGVLVLIAPYIVYLYTVVKGK